jgi:competence protein ComK
MTTIQANYLPTERTIALFPAKQIDYETIALEENRKIFIKKPAFEIIQKACIRYGASYEGRRNAVVELTGYKQKVPIPISIHKNIYTFPTHSPKNYECIWLFTKHIQAAFPLSTRKSADAKSMILLANNQQFPLPLSHYMIRKQIERTRQCTDLFSNESLFY